MKSAIEHLILGGEGKLDLIPMSAESIAQAEVVSEAEKELIKLIGKNSKLKEALRKFEEARDESNWLEVLTHYKEGFRNGFFLAIDLYGIE